MSSRAAAHRAYALPAACRPPCRYPSSIASLAFSSDGSLLAVASSYMFEQGEAQHAADAIYIRQVAEAEVKPKPRVK